jgi:C1A family cysteine protease
MKAVLCILALAVAVSALSEREYQNNFKNFVTEFEKSYSTAEFFNRYNIFKANLDFINSENLKNNSHTLGVNQFTDLTGAEFKSQVVGGCLRRTSNNMIPAEAPAIIRKPAPIDWTSKGAVTGVKNQAQCGSCWAFSATGALEGAWFTTKQVLLNLSEQQLVDCAGSEGNMGCNGGLMDYAFSYWIKNGACSESDYAYTGRDGSCKKTCKPVATVSKFVDVKANDENALGDALALGPVSVAIEADQAVFQSYKSGIIQAGCGKNLDHGVLAVGFGTDNNVDYWRVKNSWGGSWGDKGYVRIVAFKNMCGIATENSYPVV